MSKILVLGATGSLGQHVVSQAAEANHEVSALARSVPALPAEIQDRVVIYEADLARMPASALTTIFRDHDVVINTAGNVMQKREFTDLVDHVVTALESIPETARPVCWFLAGAALLDIDESGRKGVDFQMLNATYWPHRVNFDRIRQTSLDWRILCPGPLLVDQPPRGLAQMRISLDRLPIDIPDQIQSVPELFALRSFIDRMNEMMVSYKDAAALMLANISPDGEMSRHRVGLALPVEVHAR
jgi:putative NADH-flavin reductase